MDYGDIHQNLWGSFSGENGEYIFLWSIFYMDECLMKQVCLHGFFSEINPPALGLPWASELT